MQQGIYGGDEWVQDQNSNRAQASIETGLTHQVTSIRKDDGEILGEEDFCWINLKIYPSSPQDPSISKNFTCQYSCFLLKMALAGLKYKGTCRAVQEWLGRARGTSQRGNSGKRQGSQMKHHGVENCLDSAGDCTNFTSQMFSVPCLPNCQTHITYKQITFQIAIFQQESKTRTTTEVRGVGRKNSLGSLYRPDV